MSEAELNDFADLRPYFDRNSHTDVIFIREFKVSTLIGVHPHERHTPQTIRLDLDIGLSYGRRWASDDIGETVDYGVLVQRIRAVLKTTGFSLLETLAEHIADVVLDEFSVSWVRIRLAKLGILSDVSEVGLSIVRDRAQRAETIAREASGLSDV